MYRTYQGYKSIDKPIVKSHIGGACWNEELCDATRPLPSVTSYDYALTEFEILESDLAGYFTLLGAYRTSAQEEKQENQYRSNILGLQFLEFLLEGLNSDELGTLLPQIRDCKLRVLEPRELFEADTSLFDLIKNIRMVNEDFQPKLLKEIFASACVAQNLEDIVAVFLASIRSGYYMETENCISVMS